MDLTLVNIWTRTRCVNSALLAELCDWFDFIQRCTEKLEMLYRGEEVGCSRTVLVPPALVERANVTLDRLATLGCAKLNALHVTQYKINAIEEGEMFTSSLLAR